MLDTLIAAIYLRSAATNDDAIAEQRGRCTTRVCAAGWKVGEIFIDNGVSGMRDRPVLVALRACIRERRAQIVVATDADRIFRDIDVLGDFGQFLRCEGVSLVLTEQPRLDITSFSSTPDRDVTRQLRARAKASQVSQ
jgi:DNA invertase Pin-like site-specific DNA recombinase